VSAAASKTVTHRPAAKAVPADPPARTSAVDLAEFQCAIVQIGLIDAEELARFVVTPDEVFRLAGALVRARKLTAYQAAALTQGKGKGLSVGEYLVLEKLGQGGMGVVFKARHRPSAHVVALKILPPSFGRDQSAVDRFRREVEIAGRLDHPNVVAALDTGEARGVHFLATEYITGYDLDRLVSDRGPLPVELALHCTIHAARGLASAHAQGIIHRDVKPANVMLDENGCVRVLDLGLARVVEAGNLMGGDAVGSLTQSGAYMGTVDFMAPEQADDPRKVDHRADIYSLGCTLYFLLTGRPPFLADTVLKRLMAHQERPAPSLRAARPEVSKKLEDVYLQMMAKRPTERPDSMADVIDLLEACRSSPENEEEARSDLTIFARRAFKRAVPRGRDRGPDASIFAQRRERDGLQFDPDLRFEDVVMDLRDEVKPEAIPEEKLPPIAPRFIGTTAKSRSPVRPVRAALIVLAIAGVAVGGYVLRSAAPREALPRSPRSGVDAASPKHPRDRNPNPAPLRVLYADEFDDPKSGWDDYPKSDVPRGYDGGVYFIKAGKTVPIVWRDDSRPVLRDGDNVQVVGRIRGSQSENPQPCRWRVLCETIARGQWKDGKARGFAVDIDRSGRLRLRPLDSSVKVYAGDPRIGPIKHPAIKTGHEFNVLELRVHKRQVEILVNSVHVCPPVDFDWDVAPALLKLSANSNEDKARAEFDRVEVRGSVAHPSAGGTRMRPLQRADAVRDDTGKPDRGRELFADDFRDRSKGWPAETAAQAAKPSFHHWGYANGMYRLDANSAETFAWTNGAQFEDYYCEATARFFGDNPHSRGSMLLEVIRTDDTRGFQVRLTSQGEVVIEPSFHVGGRQPNAPRVGPLRHPAIRTPAADVFNTIGLRRVGRTLEVFVNGEPVVGPIVLDWVGPERVFLGVAADIPNIRAEYSRFQVWDSASPGG
jgi:serine/threonine protein kinase